MTTVAEASLLLRAQRDPSVASALQQTQKDVRATGAATKELGRDSAQASTGTRQLGAALQTTGRQAQAYTRQMTAAGNASGRMRGAVGNLGAQVQDVAVQLQSGTAGLTVFAQQGPQILSAFGPMGALLGSVAAIGALVGSAFLSGGQKAETFEEAVSGLSESVKDYRAAAALASTSTAELEKRYGAAAAEALAFFNAQERVSRAIVLDKTSDVARSLLATYEALGRVAPEAIADILTAFDQAREAAEEYRKSLPTDANQWTEAERRRMQELRRALNDVSQAMRQVTDLASDFGLTTSQAEELAAAIVRLNGARGPEEILVAMKGVRDVVTRLVEQVPQINDKFDVFQGTVFEVEKALRDAGVVLDDIVVKADEVNFENAVLSTRRLVEELAAARAEVDGLLTRGASDLETARIRRRFVGDPVGEAGALAGARFDAETSALRTPGAPTGILLELDADRRRVVEQAREVARLNEERAAAEKALRDASRPGGGGGRSAGTTRDVAGEIAAETAAIQRRLAAERQGASAIRENLILEEQLLALKRAGLTLDDLKAGKDQARAREIARQSRALFEAQAAERAAAEVSRDYARAVGESYDEAVAAIRQWRASALSDLANVGDGHSELAAKVDAVFRQRMADAYREDLERRKDWQAGIERGFLHVTESAGTLADAVENGVAGAFDTAEGAIKSLVRNGKLDLDSLADFAIETAFEIARAYALAGTAGGGGGGGGLGGLIFSAINGASGGGSGFSFTPSATPPSASTLAYFLHGGGTKADATLRRMPADLWHNAPRYHDGLKPNEFTAVLEDKERVLTEAQSSNTADTLRSLAQLAAAGLQSGPPAAPNVYVNVTGAPAGAQVETRQTERGLEIDIALEAVEGRMAQRVREGRGPMAPAIEGRYGLAPKGTY